MFYATAPRQSFLHSSATILELNSSAAALSIVEIMITLNTTLIYCPTPSAKPDILICNMNLAKQLPLLPSQKVNMGRQQEEKPRCHKRSYPHDWRLLETSNPGMIEDNGSSCSEISFEDYCQTAEIGTQIWDSYWSPTNDASCGHQVPRSFGSRTPDSSQENRIFENHIYGNSNFSRMNATPVPTNLHRPQLSPASRPVIQQRSGRSYTHPHPHPPSCSPLRRKPVGSNHSLWPLIDQIHQDPPSKRPRAQTTPSQTPLMTPTIPSQSQARPTSNFSTCTTLEGRSSISSRDGSTVYMCSTATTPLFAPPPDLPALDLLNSFMLEEKSHFDYDDDDEDEEVTTGKKLKKMLHIRAESLPQTNDSSEHARLERLRTKKSFRKLRKSLSDAASDANETFKGVFRAKK